MTLKINDQITQHCDLEDQDRDVEDKITLLLVFKER